MKKPSEKLNIYLECEAKDFYFDELSERYLVANGLEFLKGVQLPFKAQDLVAFREGGLNITRLADNMCCLIGINPDFKFAGAYLRFLAKFFNENLIGVLCSRGRDELMEHHYRPACIYFRAALMLDDTDRDAMFGYASTCREWYLSLEGDDYEQLVADLKPEVSRYFEALMQQYPDFVPSYYYLGFTYVNMGQYTKAAIIWKKFMELSNDASFKTEREEISERLRELEDPVVIERGVNQLLSGHYEDALRILEPYVDSKFGSWWPLHSYLAEAYRELGYFDEAIEGYKRVLQLSPSNIDAAEALSGLCAEVGDAEGAEKYAKKADLFRKNLAE